VPDALPEFINQRRRWLNGSFFAATYAIAHVGQLLSSGHSLSRKSMLLLQTFYNIINLIASWFAIVSNRGELTAKLNSFCSLRAISTYSL
jgi:chitin synthase